MGEPRDAGQAGGGRGGRARGRAPSGRREPPGVASPEAIAARVVETLERDPLLLEADPDAPSLVSLVVGHPVRGSWWGHPMGDVILRVGGIVASHPDVLETKLLAGKVTFVHRGLWPQVVAVGEAREPWQLDPLSPAAIALLAAVDAAGEVRTDSLWLDGEGAAVTPASGGSVVAKAARELERRLLVHSRQVHTASGAHAKVLRTWAGWWRQRGHDAPLPPPRLARDELNRVLGRLNQRWGTRFRLPWAGT